MNIRVLVIAIGGLVLATAVVGLMVLRQADDAEDRPAERLSDAVERPAEVTPAPAPQAAAAPAPPAPRPAAPSASAPPAVSAPTLTTLRVETDVPGALVFLDREFMGRAPLTIDNLEPGRRQLNVSAEGFDVVAQTIELAPGPQEVNVSLRAVRLNAAADVVHRHRFGSCRGRLVADLDGLRYETDHQDAFSAPLADLEVFQIDYLDNNLRVRLRNGRQYNFTDPEGNPDTIFVLHREVERAREQLAR